MVLALGAVFHHDGRFEILFLRPLNVTTSCSRQEFPNGGPTMTTTDGLSRRQIGDSVFRSRRPADRCSMGDFLGPAGEESANKQACLVRGGNENMTESNFQINVTKTPLFYILCIAMSWDNAKNQVDLPRTETLSTASDDYEILSPQLGPALCCAPCFEYRISSTFRFIT